MTKVFNASGTLISTTNTTYLNGVIQNKQIMNADGSSDILQYNAGVLTTENIVWTNKSKEAISYDASGRITVDSIQNVDGSASTTVWANGVETNAYITNADKSFDAIAYNVKGQTYTTQTQHSNAAGQVTSVVRTHADGTLDYTWSLRSDGSKLTDIYDGTGHKTLEMLQTSTITTTDQYDALGRIKAETIQSATGALISNAFYTFNADGTTAMKMYNASGALIKNTVLSQDGSTLTTFDTIGHKIEMDVKNADGSHDDLTYAITGQSYVTQREHFDAVGNAISITRTHADGTLDSTINFNADGSRLVNSYDSTGHRIAADSYGSNGLITQDVSWSSNGDVTTTNYTHGVSATTFLAHTDGSHDLKLFANGVVTQEYVFNTDHSEDIFSFNVTGQNYTSEHDHLDSSGHYQSVTRTHADGSLAYQQQIGTDGTTTKQIYDSIGYLVQETIRAISGAQDVFIFGPASASTGATVTSSVSVSAAIQHVSYDAKNHALFVQTENSDGGYTVTALSTGQTLTAPSGNGNDTFYSAGSTTIGFNQGHDEVFNFRAGTSANHDLIEISKLLVSEYSHLQIVQSGTDALIHLTADDSILLKNTLLASLDHGNFLLM